MKRHGSQRPAIPWTGGEFARLLLDGMKLTSVRVEETALGDHYHPLAKSVRLKTNHYQGSRGMPLPLGRGWIARPSLAAYIGVDYAAHLSFPS
jgi:hypothetical protein